MQYSQDNHLKSHNRLLTQEKILRPLTLQYHWNHLKPCWIFICHLNNRVL